MFRRFAEKTLEHVTYVIQCTAVKDFGTNEHKRIKVPKNCKLCLYIVCLQSVLLFLGKGLLELCPVKTIIKHNWPSRHVEILNVTNII